MRMLYYFGLSKYSVTTLRLARLSKLVLVFVSAPDQRRSKLIMVSGKCGKAAYCLRPSKMLTEKKREKTECWQSPSLTPKTFTSPRSALCLV